MSPLAGSVTMYPEIEEAPHSSVAVPHPFPHSHSTIQAGRQRHEEWPSADYLREARAAIFQKEAFIIDMDGVVYRGSRLLPGVREFVQWLLDENKRFLFLTNSSDKTREELQQKLARMGVDVETEHFYTAALATAAFLSSQRPNGSAYVIGDPGVMSALYSVGYSMNDVNPDYVVVGETRNYNYERLEHAVHLVLNGSKLIGTNCDKTDPSPDHPGEVIPAAGSIIKPIESATGLQAYFVGKPNPLMMRSALATLGASRRSTIIIGDRMDTDILGGLEASIDSALVLSGVTSVPEMRRFAYMPRFVLRGLVDLVPDGVPMSAVDHE
ncbi:nitrophenyl phosphatase [Klebsormidium nitens]|uniref:Nitrophenyl phosphatase n=1 Tax=Klebsormidium nitens TaxID=105231 RepID=A0A1Y1HZ79_KLENI|nr:nitrophenyl phosphatase [Klebsormidium nitens]|eukprot:GAQ83955.1 nitrophenyl phosphatase [Klebsormidium nitens]